MMGWLYRDSENHRCNRPDGDAKTAAGDIWQCEVCGTMWKVSACKRKGDQRDSWYEVTWVIWAGPVPKQQTTGIAVNKVDVSVTAWRDR